MVVIVWGNYIEGLLLNILFFLFSFFFFFCFLSEQIRGLFDSILEPVSFLTIGLIFI